MITAAAKHIHPATLKIRTAAKAGCSRFLFSNLCPAEQWGKARWKIVKYLSTPVNEWVRCDSYVFGVPDFDTICIHDKKLLVAFTRGKANLLHPATMCRDTPEKVALFFFIAFNFHPTILSCCCFNIKLKTHSEIADLCLASHSPTYCDLYPKR